MPQLPSYFEAMTSDKLELRSFADIEKAQPAFAIVALFVALHAGTIAVLMWMVRRHLGTGLVSIGIAYLHLLALIGIVMAIMAMMKHRRLVGGVPIATALGASISFILPITGLAFGYFALVPTIVAAICGVVFVVAALRQSHDLSWLTIIAVAITAILSGVVQAVIANGSLYAHVFSYEFALLGYTAADIVFHSTIAELIRNYGVSTTGVDGTRWLFYHILSHIVVAGVTSETGELALFAYPAVQNVLFVPAFLLASSFAVVQFSRLSSTAAALAPAMVIVVWRLYEFLGGYNTFIDSESYALALVLLLFGLPLALRGPGPGCEFVAWLLIAGLTGLLSVAAKFTLTFAWLVIVTAGLWSALHRSHPALAKLTIATGAAIYLALCYVLYLWMGGPAGLDPFVYARTWAASFNVSIAFAVIATVCSFILVRHRPESPSPFIFMALAILLHVPAILLKEQGGGQYYWFDPVDRVGIVIIVATLIALATSSVWIDRRRDVTIAACAALSVCLVVLTPSFAVKMSNIANTLVAFDRVATSGQVPPATFVAERSHELARLSLAPDRPSAERARGWSSILEAAKLIGTHMLTGVPQTAGRAIGETPLGRSVAAINKALAQDRGGRPGLFIGLKNEWYWQGPYVCIARNFNFQALTGSVLLAGIPGASKHCAEVAYYGMHSYDATSRTETITESNLCAAAKLRSLSAVFVVGEPDEPVLRTCVSP